MKAPYFVLLLTYLLVIKTEFVGKILLYIPLLLLYQLHILSLKSPFYSFTLFFIKGKTLQKELNFYQKR